MPAESPRQEADGSTDANDKEFSHPVYKCEDWLYYHYWVENYSTVEMAEMAGVCQQTIANWMEKHGIEHRGQHKRDGISQKNSADKISDKEWLNTEYVIKERTTKDIAEEVGVTPEAVLYWMNKFGIDSRTPRVSGGDNPNWKGGEENYYGSNWDESRKQALERDNNKCRRCGIEVEEHKEKYGASLHVHHIKPFKQHDSYKEANELDNLITLCVSCHSKLEGLPIDTT